MRKFGLTLSIPWPSALVVSVGVALTGLAGCQTPAEPRPWHDEFTDATGLYVHASRASGGYDVRFATSNADADAVQMRVRSTRPIHGRQAYFVIDGERHELPIHAKSYQARGGGAPRGAVGVSGGGGPGFHTGVGVSLGASPTRLTTFASVKVPNDLMRQIIDAEEARFRVGGPSGPTHTFSERTRDRLVVLLDRAEQHRANDEIDAGDSSNGQRDD